MALVFFKPQTQYAKLTNQQKLTLYSMIKKHF